MKSSGLKKLLTLEYPENTVNHILSGGAYYRAMRGLFLVDAALNMVIIEDFFPENNPDILEPVLYSEELHSDEGSLYRSGRRNFRGSHGRSSRNTT